jgi:hypothetical protein
MSDCPDKDVDYENGWTMEMVCKQNHIDRPGPKNVHIRQELEEFEFEVFDNHDKRDAVHFFALFLIKLFHHSFVPISQRC